MPPCPPLFLSLQQGEVTDSLSSQHNTSTSGQINNKNVRRVFEIGCSYVSLEAASSCFVYHRMLRQSTHLNPRRNKTKHTRRADMHDGLFGFTHAHNHRSTHASNQRGLGGADKSAAIRFCCRQAILLEGMRSTTIDQDAKAILQQPQLLHVCHNYGVCRGGAPL